MISWKEFFNEIKNKDYCLKLKKFLDSEYQKYNIFPPRNLIFNAFKLTPIKNIKVVIFGQDPYSQKKQAMGLSFSVPKNIKIPPSLKNIFKEISNEFNYDISYKDGDLTYLAKQGCLLLNTILTVRENQPLSHKINEYNKFIIDVLNYINKSKKPIVFMLWGRIAKKYSRYIKNSNALILTCSHPSPLNKNGGWFGNNHFKKANEFLLKNNIKKINWINL